MADRMCRNPRALVSSTRSNVSCRGHFQAMPRHRGCVSNCERSDRVRSSFASGNGPRSKSGCRGAISGKRCATCSSAGRASRDSSRIRASRSTTMRPSERSAAPSSAARITMGRARSVRTEVAAACYTLCETTRLVGVDPRAYLLRAVYAAIGRPGTVTFPEDLLASTLTG